MGTTTPKLALYKPTAGDAGTTYDNEFPANMDTLDNAVVTLGTAVGDILYWNGTSWVLRAATVAGQVLTTNGVAAAPTYQTPGTLAHPDFFEHDLYGVS